MSRKLEMAVKQGVADRLTSVENHPMARSKAINLKYKIIIYFACTRLGELYLIHDTRLN
jgi:hypothetical protein